MKSELIGVRFTPKEREEIEQFREIWTNITGMKLNLTDIVRTAVLNYIDQSNDIIIPKKIYKKIIIDYLRNEIERREEQR